MAERYLLERPEDMLIENDLTGHSLYCSVIGIGININQREFLSNAPNPVSLFQITGREYDREELLSSFLKRLYDRYLALILEKEEEIRNSYMAALYRGEGFYPYRDEQRVFQARIQGIEPTGHLILELNDGEVRRYAFKTIFAGATLMKSTKVNGRGITHRI